MSSAAGVNAKREFLLLARIGAHDLPGALRAIAASGVRPEVPRPEQDEHSNEPRIDDPLLKFSLAGVQLKFSVRRGLRGLTVPARGEAGDWIVKLPDGRPGYEGVPEAEFACLTLASAAGITVPERNLVPTPDIEGLPAWAATTAGRSFAIRRFDRIGTDGRVHAEELAQVLDIPTANERAKYLRSNYETVATVLAALCGVGVIGEVIDRIVLNVLVGNGDAHLKNWAVIHPDGRLPALSPLYDVVPTVLYIPTDNLGMKLNGSRSFESVSTSSFDRLATRAGGQVNEARSRAIDAVGRILSNWNTLADNLSADHYRVLAERLKRLPLVKQASP